MSENSSIEWCHHTHNTWWGCVHVDEQCRFCYAEAWAKRVGNKVWGAGSPRRFFGRDHCLEPLKWNAKAEKAGERHRVFCGSMMDIFEVHHHSETAARMDEERSRLWEIIGKTPCLDWLLLSKRPENAAKMVPREWTEDGWPTNVWAGTSAGDQPSWDRRVADLVAVPAAIRFVSCEPLLGEIDMISPRTPYNEPQIVHSNIHWIIAGGESGPKARPSHPDWFRSLRDQCQAAAVPYFFKQWGEWSPDLNGKTFYRVSKNRYSLPMVSLLPNGSNYNPHNPDEWTLANSLYRIGKKAAGRLLDGLEWNEFPVASERKC